MEQTNYRSFKLSNVCAEIESVITTLKQIQSQMDLKNYTKLHETIQKLQEHKQYIWQIYKDLEVLEWLKNYPGGVNMTQIVLVGLDSKYADWCGWGVLTPAWFLASSQRASGEPAQTGVDLPHSSVWRNW